MVLPVCRETLRPVTGNWPERIRDEMQPLTSLVLYRTPSGWRYAIYAGGVMDGRLDDVPTDAPEAVAQRALVRFVEEGYGEPIQVQWRPTDPDWWVTDASFAG